MRVGSLFSGIGGFDLGLERAGFTVRWQSEIEPYCCKVLKQWWPDVPNLGDIFKIKDPPPVDLICGGFPCQPFSVAGKRQGKADDRYLWPEMLRVITEVKPRWVFAENVPGILHMELDQVLSDLEGQGYETGTLIIPACALNAPHRRSRVWILGYTSHNTNRTGEKQIRETESVQGVNRQTLGSGVSGGTNSDVPNPSNASEFRCLRCDEPQKGQQHSGGGKTFGVVNPRNRHAPDTDNPTTTRQSGNGLGYIFKDWSASWPEVATRLCRVDDGLPPWVHRHRVARLKALGNAIVPQIAEEIGRMIMKVEQEVLSL